jgi:hypothetical protein
VRKLVFNHRKTRIVAVAAIAALTGGITGVAIADETGSKARAPYAQASALIAADGTLRQNKGIKSVSKPSVGRYCITFTEPRINLKNITAQLTPATPGNWNTELFAASGPESLCGNDDSTLLVTTGASSNLSDRNFYLYVP